MSIGAVEILSEVMRKRFKGAGRVAGQLFDLVRGKVAHTATVVLKILTKGFGKPLRYAHTDQRFPRGLQEHVYVLYLLAQRFRESTGYIVE